MKNALLLLTIWVGILVTAYALVYWDGDSVQPAPTAVAEPTDATYVDANGLFGLSYPAEWDLQQKDGWVVLGDPSGTVEVTIFSVEEAVPEAALLEALGLLTCDEEAEGILVTGIPVAGDAERAVRIARDGTSYGLGFLYEGRTIVVLVRGEEEALLERAAELIRIESGIAIPASTDEVGAPVEEPAPAVEL